MKTTIIGRWTASDGSRRSTRLPVAECGQILVPPLIQAFQTAGLDLTGPWRTRT